jgi:hypothetical protein
MCSYVRSIYSWVSKAIDGNEQDRNANYHYANRTGQQRRIYIPLSSDTIFKVTMINILALGALMTSLQRTDCHLENYRTHPICSFQYDLFSSSKTCFFLGIGTLFFRGLRNGWEMAKPSGRVTV